MKQHREKRISSLIQEYLSEFIARNIEPPQDALMTITNVEVTSDLKTAKIGISVLPSEKSKETLNILENHAGYLQHLLNRKLNIRPMPRIEFRIDKGPEKAAAIEKKLLEQ